MFIVDPKNNKRSVSLTILIGSFLLACVLTVLEAADVIGSVGSSFELFLVCSGLYMGRKIDLKTKNLNIKSKNG
jgi:hypothetical protein